MGRRAFPPPPGSTRTAPAGHSPRIGRPEFTVGQWPGNSTPAAPRQFRSANTADPRRRRGWAEMPTNPSCPRKTRRREADTDRRHSSVPRTTGSTVHCGFNSPRQHPTVMIVQVVAGQSRQWRSRPRHGPRTAQPPTIESTMDSGRARAFDDRIDGRSRTWSGQVNPRTLHVDSPGLAQCHGWAACRRAFLLLGQAERPSGDA